MRFVYMTGHLNGTGMEGKLNQRNEQIRAYWRANDGYWYDSDGDGLLGRNWAKDWSEVNPGKWYKCYSAHTYPISANIKAYAAWWLWATLAGWQGS